MKDAIETMMQMLYMMDSLKSGELKIALICTLFDHVCETDGFDKSEKIDQIAYMVKEVNKEFGDMCDARKDEGTA